MVIVIILFFSLALLRNWLQEDPWLYDLFGVYWWTSTLGWAAFAFAGSALIFRMCENYRSERDIPLMHLGLTVGFGLGAWCGLICCLDANSFLGFVVHVAVMALVFTTFAVYSVLCRVGVRLKSALRVGRLPIMC